MNFLRNERGLTLIEVVISSVILLMLVLTVGVMLTTSIRSDTYTQERHLADVLAQMIAERNVGFASAGSNFFDALIENDKNGATPAQPAIPGVRPAIPAEPPNDRLYNDFDWDDIPDAGPGSKNIYVYQLLIKDIDVSGPHDPALLKRITVRIYYANQNSATPAVDLSKHRNAGGPRPRRYESPLAELCTYVHRPQQL
jgi:hypothetical protein